MEGCDEEELVESGLELLALVGLRGAGAVEAGHGVHHNETPCEVVL